MCNGHPAQEKRNDSVFEALCCIEIRNGRPAQDKRNDSAAYTCGLRKFPSNDRIK